MKSRLSTNTLLTIAIAIIIPLSASAADNAELEARILQLEKIIQGMQQQKAEQDRQAKALTKEVVEVENQASQTKVVKPEEKGSSKGSPIYGRFKDGLTFEDGTGNWKLQLNGRIQADYRAFQPDEWKNDTFSIRRARFGSTFSFLNDYALRIEGEYANDNTGARGTAALTYGYLDFTRWSAAKIRIGQFKPFFGLERTQSTNFIDFTELSLATSNGAIFTSTFDRGVMVFGDPLSWLNYNAYVVNGSGQDNDAVRDSKDVGARIDANFAKLTENKNLVLHAGLSASSGSIGYNTSSGTGFSQITEGNGVKFFDITGINPTIDTDRTRWGAETAIAYGPVKLQAEYIKSYFEGSKGAVGFDNDIKTWYADLNWLLTGESYADAYKSGVFGRIRPKNNFDSKDGWGAVELGLRYSDFDASDFKSILTSPTLLSPNTYTSKASAWTAGAKWILNPNSRLMLNYVRTHFDNDILVNSKLDDTEKALVVRAQYDF